MILDKMMSYIDMFALTMELRVTTQCNSSMIVVMELEWPVTIEMKLIKKHLMPNDMPGCMTDCHVLSFKCG